MQDREARAAGPAAPEGTAAGGPPAALKPQLHMLRPDLEGLPEIVLPPGCSLRHLQPGWGRHWERIIEESFHAKPGTHSFEKIMGADAAFRPERILFVCCGDEPVAVAAAYHWPHVMSDAGMVHFVGALAAHHGRGLGYWVSLAALRRMREEGFKRAWLSTDDFRLPAIRTYLKLGFEPLLVHENQRERWPAVFGAIGLPELTRKFAKVLSGPIWELPQQKTGEPAVPKGFREFDGRWGDGAKLAWDTIAVKPTRAVCIASINLMDVPFVEELTGHAPGDYRRDPDKVCLSLKRHIGACFCDQYIPDNPLTMGEKGFESGRQRGATTGIEKVVCDGIEIDSPEAVVAHMEKFVLPNLQKEVASPLTPDQEATAVAKVIEEETAKQRLFGPDVLKVPYRFSFPAFRYGQYGYANYFMAYALYPEVMEKDFALRGELGARGNRIVAQAIVEGGLPKLNRLDHDMADSRGTLVRVDSLDRIWFPHFRRAIRPFLDAGVRLIWHCDGNLMQMVPRLIESGVSGFQGFQYEDGMDYERICRMKDRGGNPLFIWAGVSVTRTLPFGTVDDVKKEMRWLVEHGPKEGFVLGASSSVTPGTNRDNIKTMIEGFRHYREHGRGGG